MAKESFDKEIQFLRMLVLTSGAYNRQQFAERLGISIHTFDKTLKRLKDIANAVYYPTPEARDKEFSYSYFDSADQGLLFLFRAKSLKESESERIALLLATLHEQEPLTAMELLDVCCSNMEDGPLSDEKTIRKDLKYLEQVGVIKKATTTRPYRYTLNNDLIQQLSEEELTDLYDFVDIMANTQLPSVQGYLLREGLKKQLIRNNVEQPPLIEPFLYKYHYYSRILDEANLFILLDAISNHKKISFVYFSPKNPARYAAMNTNPLFERTSVAKQATILPLKVVYDHQYGRWYLLGHDSRQGIKKFRMEGITQIEEKETADSSFFEEKQAQLTRCIEYSWLIDTGRAVIVRARFYNPEGARFNFVKERVQLQGQWGQIVEETEEDFIYEIKVNGTTEIKPWLRSFGSSCEVLEPPHLRKEMMQEWKELIAYYESI